MEILIEVPPEALQKLVDGECVTVGIIFFGTMMKVMVQKRLIGNRARCA